MVTINEIKESSAKLYNPEGELLGTIISTVQFLDICCQIKKEGREGYYLMWVDPKLSDTEGSIKEIAIAIPIDKYGNLSEHPKGLFDNIETYLLELVGF